MYKFIDERNSDYLLKKNHLYNQEEILEHIHNKKHFLPISIFAIYLLGISIFLILLIEMLRIPIDTSHFINVVVKFISILSLGIAILLVGKGGLLLYSWREGISDEQIIENLNKQGQILEGRVISTSIDSIHYECDKQTHKFKTSSATKFSEGDVLAVLFVRPTLAVIL